MIILSGVAVFSAHGQDGQIYRAPGGRLDTLKHVDSAVTVWLEKEMTPGIRKDSTKMIFDEEVQRIIKEQWYRDSIFRVPYTMVSLRNALSKMELRYAAWQMINIYQYQPNEVLAILLNYETVLKTDKLLSAGFYTYALLDPRITRFVDGKPDIYRPDIMDELFGTMNAMIDKILATRKTVK